MQISKTITVAPTVTAGAYTAGYCIGGVMTFSGACVGNSRTELASIVIADKSKQAVDYNLALFTRLPTSTYTNNTAFAPAGTLATDDLFFMLPLINLATTDNFAFSANSVSSLSSLESVLYSNESSGNIYGVLFSPYGSTTVPTYASTTSISVTLVAVSY